MADLHLKTRPVDTGTWDLSLHAGPGESPALARLLVHECIGLDAPRHWFHLGQAVHASPDLGLFRLQPTLLLGSDLAGSAELVPLPQGTADAAAVAALVEAALAWLVLRRALARQAGIAGPGERVLAALPGWRDERGQSPFWQGVGQHCLPMTPEQAHRRFGSGWHRGLAPLLPRQPVMVGQLALPAQQALGRPADDQADWAAALCRQGLPPGQHVGIFDGGPVHEGHLDTLPVAGGWCEVDAAAAPPPGLGHGHCWVPLEGEQGDAGLRRVAAWRLGQRLLPAPGSAAQLPPPGARCWAAVSRLDALADASPNVSPDAPGRS